MEFDDFEAWIRNMPILSTNMFADMSYYTNNFILDTVFMEVIPRNTHIERLIDSCNSLFKGANNV